MHPSALHVNTHMDGVVLANDLIVMPCHHLHPPTLPPFFIYGNTDKADSHVGALLCGKTIPPLLLCPSSSSLWSRFPLTWYHTRERGGSIPLLFSFSLLFPTRENGIWHSSNMNGGRTHDCDRKHLVRSTSICDAC